MDKIIVIGAKDISILDSVLAHLPEQFKSLEVVTTESSNLPREQAVIMPRDMFDKIDEIDFSAAPCCSSEPKVTMEFRLPEIPKMTDMSGYFKEQERQQKLQQRETMKNISRLHSRYSKFKK